MLELGLGSSIQKLVWIVYVNSRIFALQAKGTGELSPGYFSQIFIKDKVFTNYKP